MKKLYGLLVSLLIAGWFSSINPQDSVLIEQPESIQLKQNFPNPFNPSTQIKYYLSYNTFVEINIFNILGVRLKTYEGMEQEKGWHIIDFNAEDLPAGLYVYELMTPLFKQTRKMLYLK